MTPTDAEAGRFDSAELRQVVSRLKEVRRRFVREAGDGDRFDHAEQRLDSVIQDLERGLGPGGHPVELDDIELRLAAVEEMIEGLGFPKYAHVVASVRTTLAAATAGQGTDGERTDPPPPRRFEPSPTSIAPRRPRRGARADAVTTVPRARSRWRLGGLLAVLILVGGLAAALSSGLITFDLLVATIRPGAAADADGDHGPSTIPAADPPAPAVTPTPELEEFRVDARALGEVVHELDVAERELDEGDIDEALRHFAIAAEIDRHHRGVVALAVRLIDDLLARSERAFDDARWGLAAKRIEDARHLASGLYLDTTEIEQEARRQAALTRFRDVDPDDPGAVRGAVGRAVRVTLDTRDELLGELEAVTGDHLVLSVYTGVHGGGVQFEKTIPLSEVTEIRVYQAARVADLIL